MCFGGGNGNGGTFTKIGNLIANTIQPPAGGSTPAAAVMANPAIPKVTPSSLITRRPDETRVNLGAAPATPQQTLRATLGGP